MIDTLTLAIVAATPLLLAVQGELVVQRSGIINLGIEGMMLVAALTATIAATSFGATAGFLAGIAGALIVALLFGTFAIVFRADQIVTGTAINLLAVGATGVVYRALGSSRFVTGSLQRDLIVPLAWIVAPAIVALILWRTMFGLRLRACGENPEAVTATGHSVAVHRWAALGIEAVLVGLAGAHLALALSIVIFGRWKVKGAILGTALFGIAAALQYAMQASAHGYPFHVLLAVPYVVTLLILCGIAGKVRAPESLGR